MTLPTSGTISANDVRGELGILTQAPFAFDYAAIGGYVPINQWSAARPSTSPYGLYTLASWYGYNHAATAPSISGFYVNGTGDPIYGIYTAYWTYTAGSSGSVTDSILYYSFDYGSTWVQIVSFSGTGTTSYGPDSLEGLPGFTSLDNTYFRFRAWASGVEVPTSPLIAYPPFPY
jgi:hypothetical protein